MTIVVISFTCIIILLVTRILKNEVEIENLETRIEKLEKLLTNE